MIYRNCVTIDLSFQPSIITIASCIAARYDAGICKHLLERGGVVMEKNYKVISYQVGNVPYDIRYKVVSLDGETTLDDAQGYGYTTAQKAHAAWNWKHRDKSKDKEKQARQKQIKAWLKSHKDFVNAMEDAALDFVKGGYGPDAKFNAKIVKQLLVEFELTPEFTPGEILKVWEKMK